MKQKSELDDSNKIKFKDSALFHKIFDEFIDFAKVLTWKELFFAVLAMILLGTSVAMIQSTMMGMSSWDAVSRNIYENTPLIYSWINPIVAIVLMTIVHLIAWKRPSIMFFFPLWISLIIGAVIDLELLFLPSMEDQHLVFNILYLVGASFLVGIGLNLLQYVKFPLPAIDRFCQAIADRFHLTFGQGKFIGEVSALLGAVVLGLIFSTQGDWFYLGYTTIYYVIALGFIVDLVRNPLYRILGIESIEIFADDLLKEDTVKNKLVKASRALIIKEGKILLLHYQKDDFYLIPGGTKKKGESLEQCLKREVLEETGLKIKIKEQRLVVKEYFPEKNFENHYFSVRLKSDKIHHNLIKLTKEEKEHNIVLKWIDVNEAIDLLSEHETENPFWMQLMYREFIALITAL